VLRWCNLAEESSDKTVTSARLNPQFGVKIVAWPYSRWVAECLPKTFQPSQQDPTEPPHLPALIQELRFYEFRLTDAGNVKLGAPDRAGAFDDLTTALALAVKSQMQPPERVEVVSLAQQLGVAGYEIDPRYGHQQGIAAPYGAGSDPYDMRAYAPPNGYESPYDGPDDPLMEGWTIDSRY